MLLSNNNAPRSAGRISFFKRTTALTRPLAAGVALALGVPVGMAMISPAVAQDYTSGSITGSVVSDSGGSVAGATVTVRSKSLGFTHTTTASATGGFYFTGLPTGSYEITADAAGFKTETIASAKVVAGQAATFTVVMNSTAAAAAGGTETVVVSGTRQVFDFTNTTTGVNVNVPDLVKNVPVGRDLQSLILLAPGTVTGDRAFGSRSQSYLTSIGGSSVAENAYYVNGLNITDFNTYTGSSVVPFDFYESVEVKTGGYPAEYGRATGGIVNAVTKSGSNDFMAAVHINWEPKDMRSTSPDTYAAANSVSEASTFQTTFEMGGPILKDHLFAYGLIQLNDNMTNDSGKLTSVTDVVRMKSPFYGVKADGYINDNHHLEFTYFDTTRQFIDTSYTFDPATNKIGNAAQGQLVTKVGGESYVAKYTGHFTEWLTVSGAYGDNKDRSENVGVGAAALNFVQDLTPGGVVCGGATSALCNGQTSTIVDFPQTTDRKFYRADVDILFGLMGDHHVRFGFDKELNELIHSAVRTGPGLALPGGLAYFYRTCGSAPENARCLGTPTLPPNTSYVDLNYFNTGGGFKAKDTAFYAEDEWKVTSRLTLNLGVRLDQFENFTANGSQFVDFDDLWAPRLGFSFLPWKDGSGRFYGSIGDYFLPVAGNTAFRQGARETYFREFWTFTSVGANGVPNLGTQLTNFAGGQPCPTGITAGSAGAGSLSCAVTSDGSVQDPTASIARNLKATQEREFIVGYEHKFDNLAWMGGEWTVGVNYTHRNLMVTAEDSAIDAAVNAYCAANGVVGCSSIWSGFHQYTIMNPGSTERVVLRDPLPGVTADCPDPTALCELTFTPAQLGYPKAKRTYDAVEFTFNRAFDGVWGMGGSYTWSKSQGNTEGYVQSDFGQDDAGITQDFDQPGFTIGSYGYLPNDRRHRIKLWGSYQVLPALTVGSQVQISSPRSLSCFGFDPANNYDNYENVYGAASHYCLGKLSPRGTAQQTDWIYNVNLSARYNIEMSSGQLLTLRADLFNVFDASGINKRNEIGELDADAADHPEFVNPNYGKPTQYQTPRYLRVGLDLAL